MVYHLTSFSFLRSIFYWKIERETSKTVGKVVCDQNISIWAFFGLFLEVFCLNSLTSLTYTFTFKTTESYLHTKCLVKIWSHKFNLFWSYINLFFPGQSMGWENHKIVMAGLILIKIAQCFILGCSTQRKKDKSFEYWLSPRLLRNPFNDNNCHVWATGIKLRSLKEFIISKIW